MVLARFIVGRCVRLGRERQPSTQPNIFTGMPTNFTWHDIFIRLLLTFLAAGAIGFDRSERGRAAGLRTNLLVGLAACIAMIQANLLINSNGKPSDSFVVMDIMRLPLGILSGIGFIGAGAILKRGELIVGLTTAATLWFVTVMGLCFGGGQLGLGLASLGLGLLTLSGLKRIETAMPRERSATLRITLPLNGPTPEEIRSFLEREGISISTQSLMKFEAPGEVIVLGWKVSWRGQPQRTLPAPLVELARRADVIRLEVVAR
jgi:putative Mg2+ transporter-C (MgtC) family protein